MKKISALPRSVLLLIIGIGLALISAAFKTVATIAQGSTPTPVPSATEVVIDTLEVGSTDGILFLAVLISLIIILPTLASWQLWAKKETKK